MLEAIANILMAQGLVTSQWQSDVQAQGDLVDLCRDYYDGFQRMQLTKEMKAMLNISDERLERYNINYCALIIDRMADRLTVDKFEVKGAPQPTPIRASSDTSAPLPAPSKDQTDPAQEWVDDLMDYNRFDALQRDIAVSALTDGVTYVISQYDDAEQQMCFAQELAYDGDVGTLVIYERGSSSEMAAAVKIWYDVPPTPEQKIDGKTDISLYKRVNIYYPNRIDKYYSTDGTSLTPLDVPEEALITERQGEAIGIPVTAFYNKGGVSELVNIIPMQDSLNSALVDLVMAGRLTAFSIVLAVNLNVPQGITPGMTITKNITKATADGAVVNAIPESAEEADMFAKYLDASRLERLPVGDLTQIIKGIELIIAQIGIISSTPLPGQMGSDAASGESLKQREIGMLGKLNRAQVQLGNAWEDLIFTANRIQTLDGHNKPPQIDKIDTRWKSAEMRNDADVLKLFDLLMKNGFERAALRALSQSGLASFSEADIEKMIDEKAADVQQKMQNAQGSLPDFSNGFNLPTTVPNGQPLNFNPVN